MFCICNDENKNHEYPGFRAFPDRPQASLDLRKAPCIHRHYGKTHCKSLLSCLLLVLSVGSVFRCHLLVPSVGPMCASIGVVVVFLVDVHVYVCVVSFCLRSLYVRLSVCSRSLSLSLSLFISLFLSCRFCSCCVAR